MPLPGARIIYTSSNRRIDAKGHQLWSVLQIPFAARRTAALALREGCKAIVGIFPDLQYMTAAYLAHRVSGLPLAAYLHDFMVEANTSGYLGALARWLQPRVFRRAHPLWVISDGMRDHLKGAYGVTSRTLSHAYNEPIPNDLSRTAFPTGGLRLFFSGAVYAANAASLARIARAVARLPRTRLTVFGPNSPELLRRHGLVGPHVRTGFLAERAELLRFMQTQDVFVSCLSWPDESWFGRQELAAIFSTKLPEYLAQGRPILVHCPEHYFLACFFRTHECGWIVSERSEDAVLDTLREIDEDVHIRERRCRNALEVARRFAGERVAQQFSDELAAALDFNRAGVG